MKVTNIHTRIINQPLEKVSDLFKTLATSEDKIWPSSNWPAMRFKEGLKIGSRGGHGRIRYTVVALKVGSHVRFKFTKPSGFRGTHELILKPISEHVSEVQHVIKMNTDFKASLLWVFVIRWLHDALIEEAFDNVEHYFSTETNEPKYNLWVKLLRMYYKQKRINPILTH
ncbi:hypothetical protein [Psychroserpens sp. S379A]|uniref:hypothetical protein n=1 Tax=Psychroserpens sp. S379A TaxID=3415137 RepID=UPI003C7A08FE